MDIEAMNRDELKEYRATLAAQFEVNIKALTLRKNVVKKLGGNANKGTTDDETLIALYKENQDLNDALCAVRKAQKKLPAPAKQPRLPRGNRPVNKVYFGKEWDEGLNGFQKRLVILMAREIGMDRYMELKRIAGDDGKTRNEAYYAGGYQKAWEAAK